MNVAILIKDNPEESHRPVEAVRIGLGLLSGQHTVEFILMGKAALLLGENAEDLVDGEELDKYLPSLQELEPLFYVEEKACETVDLSAAPLRIEPVTTQQIAEILAKADRHLIF